MERYDVVILTKEELDEMKEQVEKVMEYADGVKFYDHSNNSAVRRGFMAELVCRKTMRLAIRLGVGPEEYTRGYDIKLRKGDKHAYIDVKSGLIKSSWSIYTQQRHDLKLHRFKRNLPDDFMYIFISATDDPCRWVFEGACTQKEILDSIKVNTNDPFGYLDERCPYLVKKGEYHRDFQMDHDTVIVPNEWLPCKGIDSTFNRIRKILS